MSSQTRIGVFYDGRHFYDISNRYVYQHERGARLSVAGLHHLLIDFVAKEEESDPRRTVISEGHYFRERLPAAIADRNGRLASERGFEDILVSQGVQLQYQVQRTSQETQTTRGTCAVAMAAELVEGALKGRFDVAVIISSDARLTPVFRKLHSAGVRTMVLGWGKMGSPGSFRKPDQADEDEQAAEDEQEEKRQEEEREVSSRLIREATYPVEMAEWVEGELASESEWATRLFVDRDADSEEDALEEQDYSEYPLISGIIMSLKDGYGFIEKDPNNVFFHASDLVDTEFLELMEGHLVEYRLNEGGGRDGGDIGHQVRRLEVASSDEE